MTLNASGPISLGGAIVGQSVNLELGNAATATASINSTPFRTLAGVPSGTIALSNFYGKSNASYYITYLGTLSGSAGDPQLRYGFAVSPSTGRVVVTTTTSSSSPKGYAVLNETGALQGGWQTNWYISNVGGTRMPNQSYSTSDRIYYSTYINTGINYFTTANPSSFAWSSLPCTGLVSGNGAYWLPDYGNNIVVNASDTLFAPSIWNNPKTGFAVTVMSATSSGTTPTGGLSTNNGYVTTVAQPTILLRSDGVMPVIISRYMFVFPASLSASSILRYTLPTYLNGYYGGGVVDSSNNLWIQFVSGAEERIGKIDSSYSSISNWYFSYNSNTITKCYGIGIYNDILYYAGSNDITSPSSSFSVFSWNTSTNTVGWAKKFSISGTSSVSGINFVRSLVVNSKGIYIAIYFNDDSKGYVIKMPLDGNLAAASYTVGAKTFTISTVTVTATLGTTTGIAATTTCPTFVSGTFSYQPSLTLSSYTVLPNIATQAIT